MAAGLPGAGIGGVFYLVSALAMPFRELALVIGGRPGAGSAARWHVIGRQVGLALGILGALWTTGLLIGWLATPDRAAVAAGAVDVSGAPSAFRVSALLLSLGTLGLVLLIVQIGRVVRALRSPRAPAVAPRIRRHARISGASAEPRRSAESPDDGFLPTGETPRRRMPAAEILFALAPLAVADSLEAQAQPRVVSARAVQVVGARERRASADSAYARGDVERAAREYRAVLASAPDDSRALFRLAQLSTRDPAEATRLYTRYTVVEPRDAWGHLALADVRARQGDIDGALRAVRAAERVAPTERDVLVARARLLARTGRTDEAIASYERAVARHPRDAEGWRELATQRRRAGRASEARDALARAQAAAPDVATGRRAARWKQLDAVAVEPTVVGARDSDANASWKGGLALSAPAAARARATAAVSRQRSTGAGDGATIDAAQLAVELRPLAVVTIDLAAGAARGKADAVQYTTPIGAARIRWRAPPGGPAFDVRASRTLLDATPVLARNQVTRNEASVQAELPLVLGLRARGVARAARYDAGGAEQNTRTMFGGALVRPVAGLGELSAVVQRISFEQPSTRGYFAPQSAQMAEAALYAERESAGGVVLAMDMGAGMQRVTEFGSAQTGWSPALRGWARLDVPVSGAHAIRAELDAYQGGVERVTAGAGTWRWTSFSLGLHLGL